MSRKQKLDHLLEVSAISLETLSKLSGNSVFALKHRFKKRIQVYGSVSTLLSLGRLILEINASGEYSELLADIQNVDLVILEENVPDGDMRLKVSNWVYEFECLGYILYKDLSPLKYVLETVLEYKNGRLCYCLYVKNQGKDRKLVGVFDKKKQLTEFIKGSYKEKRVSAIVYHPSVLGDQIGNST